MSSWLESVASRLDLGAVVGALEVVGELLDGQLAVKLSQPLGFLISLGQLDLLAGDLLLGLADGDSSLAQLSLGLLGITGTGELVEVALAGLVSLALLVVLEVLGADGLSVAAGVLQDPVVGVHAYVSILSQGSLPM